MKIEVYGKPSCPYCTHTKNLLEKMSMEYDYIDVAQSPDVRFRFKAQGYRTVPVIVIDDEIIGGYAELQNFIIEQQVGI